MRECNYHPSAVCTGEKLISHTGMLTASAYEHVHVLVYVCKCARTVYYRSMEYSRGFH